MHVRMISVIARFVTFPCVCLCVVLCCAVLCVCCVCVWTLLFRSSQVHDNIGYGFDPHDDSDHLTIHNNHVYNNGWHGISEFLHPIQSIPVQSNQSRKTATARNNMCRQYHAACGVAREGEGGVGQAIDCLRGHQGWRSRPVICSLYIYMRVPPS